MSVKIVAKYRFLNPVFFLKKCNHCNGVVELMVEVVFLSAEKQQTRIQMCIRFLTKVP